MRTTIDIPDALFRRIKATVALRGETIKSFLLRAVQAELEDVDKPRRKRVKLPLVRSQEKSYDLNANRVAALLEEEDRELLAGR